MKKYKLYLFDFDGTLMDTADSYIEVYRKTLSKFNVSMSDEDSAFFITMSLPRLAKLKGIPDDQVQNLIDAFHYYINSKEVCEAAKLYPDTLETIQYLKDNHIKCGIVTGNSSFHIKDVFHCFDIDYDTFNVVVGNDTFKYPKPHPDSIYIALEKMGFMNRKDEVLLIGDASQDVEAAKNAGIDCVIVNRGKQDNYQIESLLDLFK